MPNESPAMPCRADESHQSLPHPFDFRPGLCSQTLQPNFAKFSLLYSGIQQNAFFSFFAAVYIKASPISPCKPSIGYFFEKNNLNPSDEWIIRAYVFTFVSMTGSSYLYFIFSLSDAGFFPPIVETKRN